MLFQLSTTAEKLKSELLDFMEQSILPAESVYREQIRVSGDPHTYPAVLDELKAEARERGLWNLFLPHRTEWTEGLSNLDYAHLAEIMGRSQIAS